jgi:hypothetical protein
MATATEPEFQAVKADLARALRRLRHDCPPTETARLLLSYDGPGQPLVGLRYDGERAVYYDERGRQAIATTFDPDGLDPWGGRPIVSLATGGSVAAWVGRMRYYWGWRHPRFR